MESDLYIVAEQQRYACVYNLDPRQKSTATETKETLSGTSTDMRLKQHASLNVLVRLSGAFQSGPTHS